MARDLLDLHGHKTDEVLDKLDRFLVDAQRANLKRVRVMTGKGTGALKKIVSQYLKQGGFPFKPEQVNGKPNDGVLVIFLD